MTGAREVSVAARRLLVLAGAVAGFWLVSWLTSGSADAAVHEPGVGQLRSVEVPVLGPAAGDARSAVERLGSRLDAAVPVSGAVERPGSRPGAAVSKQARAAVPVSGAAGRPGAAVSRQAHAAPVAGAVARAVVSGVSVSAGAVEGPVTSAVAGVAAPTARAVGALASSVATTAAAVAQPVAQVGASPVVRAVAAQVGQTVAAATAPVAGVVTATEPVARAVGAVVAPVSSAAKALLSPVTGPVAALVEPIVSALPVTTLTSVVKPVTGAATVSSVVDDGGRPIGTPVAETVVAASVVRLMVPGAEATSSQPDQARQPGPAPGPTVRAVAPGRTCAAPTAPRPYKAAAPHAGHRPGSTPGHPGAPSPTSDVATGAGSGVPPAFLTAGHAPHHFRASPWTHGDFVPLWRPRDPGTGPG